MPINIAMDGPVGAGKSTIADCVARSLGILHLDTGAMYRAVGVTALKRGIDPADREKVTEMCRNISLDVSYESDGQHTFVDGEDVTGILRTEEASMAASKVASAPKWWKLSSAWPRVTICLSMEEISGPACLQMHRSRFF